MTTWHCKQIPNGMDPMVICERETLKAEVERLTDALRLAAIGLEFCSIGGEFKPEDVIGVYDEIRDVLGDDYERAEA